MPLTPDDPRLTAYALGELDAAEQAAVEQELAESESAREALDQIRAAAAELTEALQLEPVETLRADQRAAIEGEPVRVAPVAANELRPAARRAKYVAVLGTVVSVVAASVLVLILPERSRDAARTSTPVVAESPESDELTAIAYAKSHFESGYAEGSTFESDSRVKGAVAPGAVAANDSRRWFHRSGGASGPVPGEPAPHANFESSGGSQTYSLGLADPNPVAQTASPDVRYSAPGVSLPQSSAAPPSQPVTGPAQKFRIEAVVGESPADQFFEEDRRERLAELNDQRARLLALDSQKELRVDSFDRSKSRERISGLKEIQSKIKTVERDLNENAQGLIHDPSNEAYEPITENEFLSPLTQPLSTFSIDVDTASYSNVRRFLKHGQLPPPSAVRIEELVNYFRYDYPQPDDGRPFAVQLEAGPCPWNSDHRLVRIGLKGRKIDRDQRPVSNLVFLLDVSGSMQDANKLPLVKQAMELLVSEMNENDRIAIVTYAGNAGLVLDSTSGDYKESILAAIAGLNAGGSTAGEQGIRLAYTQAVKNFTENGTNRVILCTDGDFNVGVSSDDELVRMIEQQAKSGVFLSIFGFGMGNLKDAKLEKLADKGNGHYGYIDDIREAKKVFIEDLTGTLYTIAKDVKIQVEFNPARVGSYRLLGYENRVLAARDFNDDTKDAGEIGAGHTVTALYEVVPPGKVPAEGVDALKYQKAEDRSQKPEGKEDAAEAEKKDDTDELLTVKLRYKQPTEEQSVKIEFPLVDKKQTAMPSEDFEWAASVVAFGMVLRDSKHRGQADLELVRELALGSRGNDKSGYRREFIDLVYTTRAIIARQNGQPIPQPEALPPSEAEKRAAVEGKYSKLLKRIEAAADLQTYGPFHDFGYWAGTSYAGQNDLPAGYWVYVAPHWYIWEETK